MPRRSTRILCNKVLQFFSNSAARTAAITSPVEGQLTYLEDTEVYESYDGAAWVEFGAGGGKILQVVSTIKTDTFTSTGTSFQAVTGLSQAITPSSTSSKILAIVSLEGTSTSGTSSSLGGFRLMRDATAIAIGDAAGSRAQMTSSLSTRSTSLYITMSSTKSILDTPSTTSSITYSVEVQVNAGTLYINRNENDSDGRFVSTLTLMEVAG
jgi:hypothetical protein